MSNHTIDPLIGPKYVLEGKLVTMGPRGVVPRGAIFIDAGEIKAVQRAADAPPPGFETAARIRTGDTIYPGLIELHNHLCYNAMPLWDVPQKYTNNGQWKNHADYRRQITKPSQVLGRTTGVVEALVRFVECRCLLGGVTASQGITLASAPGIRVYYEGLVRNVERTADPALPEAGTKIANPSTGGARKYLARLQGQTCYLQHLSEGTDQTARGWFQRLQLENGDWAINDAFCGIHSTALTGADLQVIRQRGGSLVWSPLSNYLLYGDTLDLRAAKASGILMGIGSDWAPSGSKNLLGELKVAWLASQHLAEAGGNPAFSAEEIVAMATINPAKILKWDGLLGSIEPGKRADLVAVNGMRGEDYLRLIQARSTSITLVVINGIPRIGQRRLMKRFGPGTEDIRVGRSRRILNLAQETAHPLVRNLSLTEAVARLGNAMQNLPDLARDLDGLGQQGLLGGSADDGGATWRVFMDIEEEDADEAALAAQPLASYVEPMVLDGITVADDPNFLPNLVAARNLPEFIIGMDEKTDNIREVKRVLYTGNIWLQEHQAAQRGEETAIENTRGGIATFLPSVFRAKSVDTAAGTFGYVRIFSFNVTDPDAFVDEFMRLTDQLPDNGLIIDIRGNPGGHIHAAERLLQVLTPRRIEPQRAQFINTPMNLQLCRQNAPSSIFPELTLAPWIRSIEQSVETGAVYSLGYPITPEAACNDIGQKYYGPVLLIVDALCYSAADIMTSGFKDHGIGPILGTGTNTGAGGANVWSHRLLRKLSGPSAAEIPAGRSPYVPLPLGSDIRVAIRRTLRVGPNAGLPVEDLGIIPDHLHQMTRRDLMEGNLDLLEKAGQVLASLKRHGLKITRHPQAESGLQLQVQAVNLNRLDILINGRPRRSLDVAENEAIDVDLAAMFAIEPTDRSNLELRGYDDGQLAAVYRVQIPLV